MKTLIPHSNTATDRLGCGHAEGHGIPYAEGRYRARGRSQGHGYIIYNGGAHGGEHTQRSNGHGAASGQCLVSWTSGRIIQSCGAGRCSGAHR